MKDPASEWLLKKGGRASRIIVLSQSSDGSIEASSLTPDALRLCFGAGETIEKALASLMNALQADPDEMAEFITKAGVNRSTISTEKPACDHSDAVDLYSSHGGFTEWCENCGAVRSSEGLESHGLDRLQAVEVWHLPRSKRK